jgi:hypothetical protein
MTGESTKTTIYKKRGDGLPLPDMIQVAGAMQSESPSLTTNDNAMEQIGEAAVFSVSVFLRFFPELLNFHSKFVFTHSLKRIGCGLCAVRNRAWGHGFGACCGEGRV